MPAEIGQPAEAFQVDLGRIVGLLARHLYTTPAVYLRELLQNAADAVTARRLEDPGQQCGSIRIVPAELAGGGLEIHDDGIGLDEADARAVLATVGASGKRDASGGPRAEFLGRFGIGMLSCFLVCDRIHLTSRKLGSSVTLEWVSSAAGTFTVRTREGDDPVGTVVRLAPRAGGEPLLTASWVGKLARRFACWLPVPVRVELPNGGTELANPMPPPWEITEWSRDAALNELGREVLGTEPLAVVPLRCELAGLSGAAFVLPYATRPGFAAHRVHVRGMLVTQNCPQLLPGWAFWVRAVVDADELTPAAGREDLVEDDMLAAAREDLGRQLREWLLDLVASPTPEARGFLEVHALAVKAAAVHDDELFRMVLPWLPFETTLGPMPLPALQERAGIVRYARTVETYREVAAVAAAQAVGVVNAGNIYDTELVTRLPDVLPGARTAELAVEDLLVHVAASTELADPAGFVRRAQHVLTGLGVEVVVRSFAPDTIAALHLEAESTRLRRRVDEGRDLINDASPWGAALAEWADDTDTGTNADSEPARPLLLLNTRNILVRRIARARGTLFERAIEVVYVRALLLSHRPLRPEDHALADWGIVELLDHALGTQ